MTSLSVVSYIERINRMYRLIRKESTGSRAELAGRMRVSERTVSNYLEELRLMGADIRFSKTRNTYYFFNRFVLYATFEARIDADVLDDVEEVLITSDVGVETTVKIIRRIEERVARDKYMNTSELQSILREEVMSLRE